jgi:hypothetical protein
VTTDSTSDITPIDDYFPDESLLSLSSMPWFAKNINFLTTRDLQLIGVPKTNESF